MDKKPLKRNEHIVKLSKDHHFTLLFCWKIRTGLKFEVEQERIKNYVQYFWQHHMQPHFKEEETILFVPVKDPEVQRAFSDHAQIVKQIKALNTDAGNIKEQLLLLADAVDNHVRYEERELFPHLEKVLTKEQLDTIGRQLADESHSDLKDDYPDQFWVKNKTTL